MGAAYDVLEESLRVFQLGALQADPSQPPLDGLGTAFFAPVEHQPYLGKAQADALAGLNDAETTEVFLCVDPMARWATAGDNDPHVMPVPQDVNLNAELPGNLTDLQRRTSLRLDLRLT